MNINSKNSFDLIFNFSSKNKNIKRNYSKLNKIKLNSNKIIKANRGLSTQKLKPKIFNKKAKETEAKTLPKNQEIISHDKSNK